MGNSNLNMARRARKDEFYTQYETIEEELIHYKKHFEGKTVYCNCDDPRWSNFFKYFVDNFHELKLKRLIASCYVDQSYNLFTINDKRKPAVWASYDGWLVDGRAPKVSEIEAKELKGDGDFRSEECIELLKQADIIVTNPPFSLFREFVSILMKYDKKFLTIGNFNAITYKNIFSLIRDNKIWMGCSTQNVIDFYLPSGKIAGVNAVWWTNIDKPIKHKDITLTKIYKGNEDEYPKYDNYDAINVDKVADIPKDFKGVMGVPIGIIGQWNPEQFEIVGAAHTWTDGVGIVNGVGKYFRILIRNKYLNPELYSKVTELTKEVEGGEI